MKKDKKSPFIKLVVSNEKINGKMPVALHSVGDDETSYQGNQSSRIITFDKK